jgi:glycosyltransferase involved in cell wall biosynthesis
MSAIWGCATRLARSRTMENKEKIVLSGVNCVNGGILSIFQEALHSVVREHGDRYEIIAIVHRRDLFDVANVTYMEFPEVKSSWMRRLRFEYRTLRKISERLQPRLWLSMHDMTPNVTADIQAVYCHNPSPFYRFDLHEALLDPKFGLFTLFYRYLYRINLEKNDFVIVQQEWLRREFRSMYGIRNVIVAKPTVSALSIITNKQDRSHGIPYRMFYPALPRTFKNFEVILTAARSLANSGFFGFELFLTVDGTENRYAAEIKKKYADVQGVRWLGLLSRQRVFELYGTADCLIFPSKLESWGLPITEFKATAKPILAADLPYAHETMGDYPSSAFFDPNDADGLAEMIKRACLGEKVFAPSRGHEPEMPFARNWNELWPLLLTTYSNHSS